MSKKENNNENQNKFFPGRNKFLIVTLIIIIMAIIYISEAYFGLELTQ